MKSKKMTFETETTVLFYAKKETEEIREIMPISDMIVLCNPINRTTTLIVKRKLGDLGRKLKRLSIVSTNDPQTEKKFVVSSLGYYSIRVSGEDCEVYHLNQKEDVYTMFKFDIDKFNIYFNLSVHLPQYQDKSLFYLLDFNNKFKAYHLKFGNTHNEMEISVYENKSIKTFWIDNLAIEDNFKFINEEEIEEKDILRRFGVE